MTRHETALADEPLWYKDAVIYELHIKSFYDSTADGMGDIGGLIEKLDYLEGLGITAIWLLPFYPSPLRDDGYDIGDYFNINPDYGTLRDFRRLLKEAHRRGLRVITELVVNHTSDQHPWFQRARRSRPGSIWRDYYVWSDTREQYKDARIIFRDFEASNWAWDPVAKAYYWHRFYSHQPDLNYDNPRVRKEIFRVLDFWFGMGIDGLRLDAVPYLYEREGTNCENLPETHRFLKDLRAYVDRKYSNRMLLAEANQWPEDAAAYFGDGEGCHMAFHFPVMPRLFMALRMEDRFPVIDIMEQTPAIAEVNQWAMFLRNHDELTLEMVTDEERDYMYRVYAQDPRAKINLGIRRRLAPLLDNNRRKIELMNKLLFSLPGTPVIYYGDEIGMGDNYYLGDRDGVRTPMQWSPDRNAGFSKAPPQRLYLPVIIDPEYHYEALNVENQESNLSSLLWWMKRVIAMRKRFKAFGRGTLEFLSPRNSKVLVFVRHYLDERVLVVMNLSRFAQVVELELPSFAGCTPREVFSQNTFPAIKDAPYMLTLGPYECYWFFLEREREILTLGEERIIPDLGTASSLKVLWEGKPSDVLQETILPEYLKGCRWFGGKARIVQSVGTKARIPVTKNGADAQLLFLEVEYTEGSPELYLLPLSIAQGESASHQMQESPKGIVARLRLAGEDAVIYESVHDEQFRRSLLALIARKDRVKGTGGELVATPGRMFKRQLLQEEDLASRVLSAEQTNTAILYKDTYFLKLYRRLGEGVNPDMEVGRFLTETAGYHHVPPYAGAIEWKQPGREPVSIALLQGFVPSEGDAWSFTLDAVGRYFERVLSRRAEWSKVPPLPDTLYDLEFETIPALFQDLIGGVYLENAALLGRRTGEMHLSLCSNENNPDFAPEAFSTLYQRSVYQSMRSLTRRVFQLLQANVATLPGELKDEAESLLGLETEILNRLQRIMKKKFSAMKIRVHGDYHLGQVLYTGKDFMIIDFEGEPARPLSERRLKRSALRDVAGMIRSFHYAGYGALFLQPPVRPEDISVLEPWADLWYAYVSGVFLTSYVRSVGKAAFVPTEREEFDVLLQAFLLEKAVYELGYELNNRPDWVIIPIRGIAQMVRDA